MCVCGSEASYLHGHKAGCYRERIAIGVCVFEDSNTHARTHARTHTRKHAQHLYYQRFEQGRCGSWWPDHMSNCRRNVYMQGKGEEEEEEEEGLHLELVQRNVQRDVAVPAPNK